MATHDDKQDRLLDRNLAEIGRRVSLPDEPDKAQCARWRQPSAESSGSLSKGVRLMRKHKVFTVVGASSALAACLALTVALFGPWGKTEVEAATIFQSLREAVSGAFSLEFEDIKHDGVTGNGRVLVVFDQTEDEAGAGGRECANLGHEAVYAEFQISADEDHAKAPGLEIETALSLRNGREWLFIQTRKIPPALLEEHPMMALIASMARNGLLLKLDGIMEHREGGGAGGVFAHVDTLQNGEGAENEPAASRPSRSLTLGFRWHGDAAPSGADGDAGGPTSQFAEEGHSRQGIHAHFAAGQGSMEHDEAMLHHIAETHGIPESEAEEFVQGIRDMFRGRMRPEQVTAMVSHIEQAAGEIQVEDLGHGLYRLHAEDFDVTGLSADDPLRAELPRLVLEIMYREDSGVQEAVVRNVGDSAGTIRFELSRAQTSDAVFDRQRWLERDGVVVLDLAGIINMFHGGVSDSEIEVESAP